MTVPVTLLAALAKGSVLMTITLGSGPVYGVFVWWAASLRVALAESTPIARLES